MREKTVRWQWWAGVVVAVAVVYSLVRYGLVKGEPVANWPAFIGNKALAFTAVGLLLVGVVQSVRARRLLGDVFRWAARLAIAHALLSAALLTPAYFDYLHADDTGRYNAYGELALLFGGLALAGLVTFAARGGVYASIATLLGLLVVHILAVGLPKWVDPGRWTGGLVPISLLSCLMISTALVIWLVRGRGVAASPSANDARRG